LLFQEGRGGRKEGKESFFSIFLWDFSIRLGGGKAIVVVAELKSKYLVG
jgi:hypothetical protein